MRSTSRTGPCGGATGPAPVVEITLLGGFSVRVDGVAVPAHAWARRSGAALVKILALTPAHRLHREQVLDLLWPDDAPVVSAPRLHKAAHFARRAAGRDGAVVLRDDVVHLFPDAALTVDALAFEQLARAAVVDENPATAGEALRWYRGDLLPDDRYEDWVSDRRELLRLRHLDVLRVAERWHEVVELAPTDEDAHVQLMRRHLAAGDGRAALRQYADLDGMLRRELGVPPSRQSQCALLGADVPPTAQVSALLAELAGLVRRQGALLAELAAAGVPRSPTLGPPLLFPTA